MKYVLFFSGVVLFQMISSAYGGEDFASACAKELGIPEATFKLGPAVNAGKPEFRCFDACLMKKDGSLEPGNKINFPVLKAHLSENYGDKSHAIYNLAFECAKESAGIADECDFVNAANKCVASKISHFNKYSKR